MKRHGGMKVGHAALLACAMAAFGPAAPAFALPEPDTAQFTCDLTGDCAPAADPAAAAAVPDGGAPATAVPGRPAPRGSATRGFSFRRATTEGNAAPAAPAATATMTPSVATPTRGGPAPARPTRVGSADLGLSFEPASAVLTAESKARLVKFAGALGNAKLASRRLRIEGHTDASGSPRVNQELSQRRAQAVADFLVQAGIDRQRLEVKGFGSSSPLPGAAPQSAANRRVMAVLL